VSTAAANTNQSQVNPWNVQQPYLTQAFNGASSALPTASQFTPAQLDAFTTLLNEGQNPAVANNSANSGGVLSNAGTSSTVNGLYQLAGYNPANINNNSNVLGTANSFVANANIPGQVSAAMVPAEQAAAYGLNPQIDQNAAASGNTNSSRDAIEYGILASNLSQQANALSTQLGANAFNTGANIGETMAGSNSNNTLASILGQTQGALLTPARLPTLPRSTICSGSATSPRRAPPDRTLIRSRPSRLTTASSAATTGAPRLAARPRTTAI
jgi:hypothetical protein